MSDVLTRVFNSWLVVVAKVRVPQGTETYVTVSGAFPR